jgi:two-component system sensor histidine kinase CpxA
MRKEARFTEDRNAAAARVTKEIERLTNLVGALVEVTRVEGDPASRRVEHLDLDRLAQDLLEARRMEADARGRRFHFESGGALPVRGDRELLRRAIENVLRKAIRYATDGSAIDVRLESAAGKASIVVRDYGPGVPDEMLPRIFQPFFRADGSRDSQTGGVGLGLAIAHRAIGAHHGQISAENAG